ncbi:spore germination protein [Paenibacillus methanolicus]|uniref:Spore germination protein KA n=1 Tax=Paenibacillus methanolicus TaxID=582686 RepID=A0A5S5C1A9_9BACL|nr:spore germination protein [Paenibacillus methanolicus]TYP72408.1 spore germination protein KA [Paenibacillus methanolicus]
MTISTTGMTSVSNTVERIKTTLGDDPDLIVHDAPEATVVYLCGLIDISRLEREVLTPLSEAGGGFSIRNSTMHRAETIETAVKSLLNGSALLIRHRDLSLLTVNLISMPHRPIETPDSEPSVRGPHEGFTEMLAVNVALIRRRLVTDKLRVKSWMIGSLSQTEVRLLYLEGTASPEVVEEMARRIGAIKTEAILESTHVEECIRDHPYSLFPTMLSTERPDVVSGSLLEGRVAVLVNNSPFAIIAPYQFWTAFQASEDYYLLTGSATFVRLVRAISMFIALLLPSLYVAITTFHPEMMPTNLLLSIAAAREVSPFPALIEALLMELTFEALREAAIRLPRIMGQTVGIVGALVIGQAVVQAGIVSTPMVIVVSMTGIASLMIPRYNMTFPIRILRFLLLFMAGSLGLVGILFGLFLIGIYLTGIKSVGVPYLTPIAPLRLDGMRDLLIRLPLFSVIRPAEASIASKPPEADALSPRHENEGGSS